MIKRSRDKINEALEYATKNEWEFDVNTTITLEGNMCLAKATVAFMYDNQVVMRATGHKITYQKPDADGMKDTSFVSAAETMAISRAISFILKDEAEIFSQEDFQELLVYTTKRVADLYRTSTKSAREYISGIENQDLRKQATIFLDGLLARESAANATKNL